MRAIVTGHSRGLGAAIADALLARGIHVLGISRKDNADLARRRDGLREVRLDLSDTTALLRWLAAGELRGFLDPADTALLVNNAGLLQPVGPLDAQDVVAVTRAIALNVGAVLALSAAFVQATPKAVERRILHISSGSARRPYAGWSVYSATKAALDHHARAVQLDATPRLRIASAAPGVLDTDMQGEVRASAVEAFPQRERFVQMKREGALKSPQYAAGQVVEYLLSDAFGSDPAPEMPR